MSKVFLNGEIINIEEARVSVNDTGLLYGAGVFETIRAAGGKVFRLGDHIDRLLASSEKLRVPVGMDKDQIAEAVVRTVEANGLADARVRLTVTSGSVGRDGQPVSTVLVTAGAYQGYPKEYYDEGVKVVLTDHRQSRSDVRAGHKTTSYYDRILVLNTAHVKRAAEAIWFTHDNHLAEGCVSNVFLVKDGALLTPPVDTPVLPGIARGTVLEAARSEGIDAAEKDLFIHDLLGADEVFLSNVIMGVLPVVGVEAHTVGEGKVGQLTKKMMQLFNEIVERQGQ